MSQTPPESKPKKTGYRWLWVLLALFCVVPVMMIVGLIALYMLRSQAVVQNYAARQRQHAAQDWQLQEAPRTVATLSTPVLPPVVRAPQKRPHVVRIQLDFEDFDTRFANAITVDRDAQGARLMVPSAVFAPMSGKINGRIVTRTAGVPKIVAVSGESWPGGAGGMGMAPAGGMPGAPGMAGGTIGGSPVGAGVAIPEIGLTELTLNNWDLTPIRVIGDFPEASIGDKLNVVSLPEDIGLAREVTVLGLDESLQLPDGAKLDHLLKLSESTGATGALAINSAGDPIGQIIFTTTGKLRYSYAVPMNRIFQALYDHKLQGNTSSPFESEPRQGLDFRSSSPELTSEKMEHDPFSTPVATSEFPPEPIGVLPAGPRLDEPLTPDQFLPTRQRSPAQRSLPDNPPVASPIGEPPGSTNPPPRVEITPADASRPDLSPGQDTQVYQIVGSARNVGKTLLSLYGDVAKIGLDQESGSIVTLAPPEVQERISATIKDLNKRAQQLQDEQAKQKALAKEQEEAQLAKQLMLMDAQQRKLAAKEAEEDEAHRKNPQRTRAFKVTGRDPQEVAKVLSSLFGQTADVAIDERTSTVLITINRAKTWGEVQFLLSEIEATAARLMQEVAATATGFSPEAVSRLKSLGMSASPDMEERQQVQLYSEQDREAKQLALQLRTAAPPDQPALRTKLEKLTEQQFRARQDLRKKEIDDLGNRIDQLRVTQLRRQQNQAEIIRRRVEELLDPNSDLQWEPPQDVQTAPPSKPPAGESPEIPSDMFQEGRETTRPKAASVEQTFDGIAYSQWLKILETEVKPTKLAAAIEACGRLAISADRRRIAKLIIQKASLFEAADQKERAEVWNAAETSLAKFPMTDVVDEILISLADPEADERGRIFQGRFLLHYPKAVKQQDRELVAALVKAIQQNGKDRNCLLAAACQLWHVSDHPLEDFEGLRPLVMERINGAPESTSRWDEDWYVVALALVLKNPETPDLALKLWKISTGKNDYDFQKTTELLGRLGRHAEPAVPAIIEQILIELERIDKIADARGGGPVAGVPYRQHSRAIELVRTLGAIGAGENTVKLLKELSFAVDAYPRGTSQFAISQEAQEALEKFPEVLNVDGPPILGDEFLVRGIWQLHRANFEKPGDCEAQIGRGRIDLLTSQNGNRRAISDTVDGNWIAGQVKLDPTKMVKEIIITNPGDSNGPPKRNGIYELTETTFKIYLAPINKPAPTEMIEEGSAIPDGYSLVEWRRSLSIPPRPGN
jgi:hypothetical protein